ncbi:unnamed protein product [Clonostachys rosea]|uniref:C2H2-type domain-containing protein n=1 Tax=Bionectria ochroleuca TaxID=29856 RepID=A0ABY6UJP1_BIOOC|nr:unnamed protein product [Clonostachys rosea]
MTSPQPHSLRMGASHLFKSHYGGSREGVQPVSAAVLSRSGIVFSQGEESYDAGLYPSILAHSLHAPLTNDLDLANTLELSKAGIESTTDGFHSLSHEACSSNYMLNGGDPPSSCGAPSTSTSDGRGMVRPRLKKRGRGNNGGEKGEGEGDDRSDGDGRGSQKRQRLDPQYFFGCPYYKLDPRTHLRCYRKYELKRVADVKDHIKRVHTMKRYYCPTCFTEFRDEQKQSWEVHVQARNCRLAQRPELILYKTFEELSQAFKRARDSSEWDKWYVLYDHVFPGVAYRPASPYVHSTFDEPLQVMREYAFREEASSGWILAVMQQYGVPLEGIDLVSLRTSLINTVLPTLEQAVARSTPSQMPLHHLLMLPHDGFVEPQNQFGQDLPPQQLQQAPEEYQQDDQPPLEQLLEQ